MPYVTTDPKILSIIYHDMIYRAIYLIFALNVSSEYFHIRRPIVQCICDSHHCTVLNFLPHKLTLHGCSILPLGLFGQKMTQVRSEKNAA